jgi:hypothetical protein
LDKKKSSKVKCQEPVLWKQAVVPVEVVEAVLVEAVFVVVAAPRGMTAVVIDIWLV